ncbi:MAG: S8 family serine peptidase [Candidatus Coatesbacteria bacterium]|nr:S8 family serine peptidase [Candidatus Coatesbacteria bacterium]
MQRAISSLAFLGYLAISTLGIGHAAAETGYIGYEFDAPQELSPRGLAVDEDGLLYCSGVVVLGQLVTPMLYVLDTVGGTSRESFVIDYIVNSIDEVQPRGCAWDGENVWVLDSGSVPRLLCINPLNGDLVSSFTVDGRMIGLAYDGENLACLKSASGGGTLIWYSRQGTEVGRADIPASVGGYELIQGFGLAADGKSLFISATCKEGESIMFTRRDDGGIDSWFTTGGRTLYDMAFDGLYLWTVDYNAMTVARIDVGRAGNTGTVAVQINNGSENAEGCPLPRATVVVNSGTDQEFLESDHLGRVCFRAVNSSENVTLTVSKSGYQDHTFDSFSVTDGSMNILECDLAPAGGMITPCDSSFDKQWALYEPSRTADINAPTAWYIERGDSTDVVVALISTGVDPNHPDLRESLWRNQGELDADGIDNDGNGLTDDVFGWSFTRDGIGSNGIFDEQGTGTAVAGIIAAIANNDNSSFHDQDCCPKNVAGVSWGASIMALKFDGSRQALWKAVRYAVDMGAKIAVIPVGFDEKSAQLEDAVNYAKEHDILVISGTGDTAGVSGYPASYEGVLAVGATGRNGQVTSYSSSGGSADGRKVDVVAPGGSGGPGDENGIYTTLPTYASSYSANGYALGYDYVHGTACSAGFAAGACALIRSYMPTAPYAEVISRLKGGARSLGDANRTGSGLIDIYAALVGESNDLPPVIEEASFGDSYISQADGGNLIITAKVSTPDARTDISKVELYFEGAPTGLLMRDDGLEGDSIAGDGIYTYSIFIFPGMFASGQYLVGIAATDSSGKTSDMWPYLTVKDSLSPSADKASKGKTGSLTSGYAADGTPSILSAGLYGSSASTQGGVVNITAVVRDSSGITWGDIDRVELFLEGQSPLEAYLKDDGTQGDKFPNDGTFTLYTGVGGIAAGQLILEIVAFDNSGQRSDTWPYLTIH